jgi:hypothetical protein
VYWLVADGNQKMQLLGLYGGAALLHMLRHLRFLVLASIAERECCCEEWGGRSLYHGGGLRENVSIDPVTNGFKRRLPVMTIDGRHLVGLALSLPRELGVFVAFPRSERLL